MLAFLLIIGLRSHVAPLTWTRGESWGEAFASPKFCLAVTHR